MAVPILVRTVVGDKHPLPTVQAKLRVRLTESVNPNPVTGELLFRGQPITGDQTAIISGLWRRGSDLAVFRRKTARSESRRHEGANMRRVHSMWLLVIAALGPPLDIAAQQPAKEYYQDFR